MTAQQVKRQAKVELEQQLNSFQVEVQKLLTIQLKKSIVLRPSMTDSLRLFNLRMWSLKYNVPVKYILETLIGYWLSTKNVTRKKPPRGIGVRIPTLVGPTSRKVLESAILRDFPNRENELQARAAIEERFLASEEVMGADGSFRLHDPAKFIKAYMSRIKRAKKGLAALEERMQRRQWRGNPYKA